LAGKVRRTPPVRGDGPMSQARRTALRGDDLVLPWDPASLADDLDRHEAERSLRRFLQLAWPIVEPARPFVPGWHVDAICEHLEAVTRGEITRLLINIPPGCMKSLLTNVFWPAWEWGPRGMPGKRFLSFSYSVELTVRDNRRCRQIIQSPWYQRLWGDRFRLVADQDAKIRYDNDKRGYRIATSVAGMATGERGDRVVVDDPHNVKDGESEADREAKVLWERESLPTRLSDPRSSAIIFIMQRIHEQDVSGDLLARDLGYEHLCLPMEFEADRRCRTSIGFVDPRLQEGDLLWPEYMTREVVDRDKRAMGAYAVAGQFQQRPAPREGGLFRREWFEVVPAAPAGGRVVRAWDLASSDGDDAPWTRGVRVRRHQGVYYVEDVVSLRSGPGAVTRLLRATASQDGHGVAISIPQDPGQAGKAQVKHFATELSGYTITATPETGDKLTRAEPVAAQAEAGNVRLVRGPWNEAFLEEVTTFPAGRWSDQVDALSRAFAHLNRKSEDAVPTGILAPRAITPSGGG